MSELHPVGMPTFSGLCYNRGEAHFGEQKFVYFKRRFTLSEVALSEEFLVTTKNTFSRDFCLFLVFVFVYNK